MRRAVLTLAAAAALAAPALANDSTAEIGAGGIEMVYNSAIEMMSEDLYISADEIRVRYVFRNVTKEARTFTIAFPLPPLDAQYYDTVGMTVFPDTESENYVGFSVAVDGVPLQPAVMNRVTALGVDRTAEMAAFGLPLHPAGLATGEAIAALTPQQLREANALGLLLVEEWGTLPAWKLETVFYWEQTFPAGAEVVVEHRYQPVVGYGFFGDYAFTDPYYVDNYCMDDAFRAGAQNRMGGDAEFPYLNERRLSYILTTGANWAGPIGTFHLTVDKGSPDALVSFCAEGDVVKTGNTTFEMTITNFYPVLDLHVLLVAPVDW
ncbi:MAG: DUF4424 domain-containing protein [Bauldia sp.]|nr:DUF4424 domain-containing protein [Bauldia sp.]